MKNPHYVVIFDTNILIYNKRFPINSDIPAFIKNYSVNRDITLEYKVPYVVQEEYIKNNLFEVKQAKSTYITGKADLAKLVGFLSPKFTKSETELKDYFEKLLRNNHIEVIKTPIKHIDFDSIIDKAIYYKPPFIFATKEKGFKDAIISETIFFHIKSESKEVEYVFICNDMDLREYMLANMKEFPHLHVYDSLQTFESELKLKLLNISKKKIEALTKEAYFAFNDETNPNALFWDKKIHVKEQIYLKYRSLFENPKFPDNSSDFYPIAHGRYELSMPVFIGEKGKYSFVWESHVIYVRRYFQQQHAQPLSSNIFRTILPLNEYYDYILEFVVEWEATIKGAGKITASKVNGIKHISTKLDPKFIESMVSLSPSASISGASLTASGIGTISTSLSPSMSPSHSHSSHQGSSFHSSGHSHHSHGLDQSHSHQNGADDFET